MEDIKFTKNGNFRKGRNTYIEKDKCVMCGENYLSSVCKLSEFCSKSCGHLGNKHKEETKIKLSVSHIGKKHSEETIYKYKENRKGSGNAMYGKTHSEETKLKISKSNTGRIFSEEVIAKRSKGGVVKLNLPLYDTYAHQLNFAEEVRSNYNKKELKLLEIKCSKCGKWYVPTTGTVRARIKSLKYCLLK